MKQVSNPSRLEWPQILAWLWQNRDKNCLDLAMLDYPTLEITGAYEDGSALAYMPKHAAVIIDSMAWSPEATVVDKVESAEALLEQTERQAFGAGVREIFYVSSDDRTDEWMSERGYVKTTCYRKRMK